VGGMSTVSLRSLSLTTGGSDRLGVDKGRRRIFSVRYLLCFVAVLSLASLTGALDSFVSAHPIQRANVPRSLSSASLLLCLHRRCIVNFNYVCDDGATAPLHSNWLLHHTFPLLRPAIAVTSSGASGSLVRDEIKRSWQPLLENPNQPLEEDDPEDDPASREARQLSGSTASQARDQPRSTLEAKVGERRDGPTGLPLSREPGLDAGRTAGADLRTRQQDGESTPASAPTVEGVLGLPWKPDSANKLISMPEHVPALAESATEAESPMAPCGPDPLEARRQVLARFPDAMRTPGRRIPGVCRLPLRTLVPPDHSRLSL
jgi:hypothetical protein